MTDDETCGIRSFYSVGDRLPIGICIISRDMRIVYWNRTLERWTHYRSDDVRGRDLFSLFPDLNTSAIKNRITSVFELGTPSVFTSSFTKTFFPVPKDYAFEGRSQSTSIIPYFPGEEGDLAIIVVEDVSPITEQVTAYRLLRDQVTSELEERIKTERALAIANKKLNMLSSLNRHDLQNLLTAFEGYLIFSLDADPSPIVRTYLEKMVRVKDVMKRQLEFSRNYQDTGIKAPVWHFLPDMIDQIKDNPLFGRVTFDLDLDPVEILADPLFHQAIYNLLENAVRHGEHTTRIRIHGYDRPDGWHLIISDNGVGVEPVIKERIFSQGFGKNTGLGLFLTREILDITGISIRENGVPGEGASFELIIPSESVHLPSSLH